MSAWCLQGNQPAADLYIFGCAMWRINKTEIKDNVHVYTYFKALASNMEFQMYLNLEICTVFTCLKL